MDKVLQGFSALRHGLPLALLLTGVSAGILTYLNHATRDPLLASKDAEHRLQQQAQIVNGIWQRYLDPEKPGQLQNEIVALQTSLSARWLAYIDSDGMVLAATDTQWVGRTLDDLDETLGDSAGIVRQLKQGPQDNQVPGFAHASDATTVDGVFPVRLPGHPQTDYLIIREPIGAMALTDSGLDERWRWLLLAVAPGVLSAGLAYWFLRSRVRFLVGSLLDAQRRFASGDMSVRLRAKVGGEFGAIARSFNDMVEDVASALLLLRRRTTRLDDVFDGLPDLLFVVHEDGSILEQRGGGARNLPDNPRDFIGRKITEILPLHLKNMLLGAIHDAVLENKTSSVQYSLNLPAGIEYFEAQLRPIRDDQVIVLIRNITERHRLERDATARDERFAIAERQGSVGTWYWELGSDRGHFSPGLLRLFGLAPEHGPISYDAVMSAIHSHDAENMQALLKATVADGNSPGTLSFRVITPGGFERHLHSTLRVQPGAAGIAVALHGTVMDVTELLTDHALLDDFFARSKDCFAVLTLDGRLQRVNPEFAKLCGRSAHELARTSFWTLVHPDDLATMREAFAHAFEEGDLVDWRCVTREGEDRLLACRFVMSSDSERVFLMGRHLSQRPPARAQVLELHRAPPEKPTLSLEAPAVRDALAAMPADSWHYDRHSDAVSWGEAVFTVFGLTPGSCKPGLQLMLAQLASGADRKDLALALHRCMDSGQPFDLELAARHAQGRLFGLRIVGRFDRTAGELGSISGTMEEVALPELLDAPATSGDALPPSPAHFSRTPGEVLTQIRATLERSSADFVMLLSVDEAVERVVTVAAPDMPADYCARFHSAPLDAIDGACVSAILCNENVMVADIAQDPAYVQLRESALASGLHAAVAVPVGRADGSCRAALGFYYRRAGKPDPADINMLTDLAGELTDAVLPDMIPASDVGSGDERDSTSPLDLLVDLSGRIHRASPLLLDRLGYTSAEVAHLTFSELLVGDSVLPLIRALERASLDEATEGDYVLHAKDNSHVALTLRSEPAILEDEQPGLLLTSSARSVPVRHTVPTTTTHTQDPVTVAANSQEPAEIERFSPFIHERISSAFVRDGSAR